MIHFVKDNNNASSKSKRLGAAAATASFFALLLALLTLLALTACSCTKAPALFKDTLPDIDPDPNTHVSVSAASEPVTMYKPPVDGSGYRYGPSIMYYADGSCDAWFSTPGWNGEWDWITYKHSEDGVNFTDEKVVLMPTPDSMDKYSCCDPGVIYFGGYYYLGYTSTLDHKGYANNVFVARSRTPDGPFEKWNGSGYPQQLAGLDIPVCARIMAIADNPSPRNVSPL